MLAVLEVEMGFDEQEGQTVSPYAQAPQTSYDTCGHWRFARAGCDLFAPIFPIGP
jgi:hypothetical protein